MGAYVAPRSMSSTSPSGSTTVSAAHPVARRAVLERRRAGGVGGDDAADERAGECRRRRIVAAGACQRGVEIERASRRLRRGRRRSPISRMRFSRDVLRSRFAHRRRAAGQRRLRAYRQHAGGGLQDGGCSPSLAGAARPTAWPPGKCAASSRKVSMMSRSRRTLIGAVDASRGLRARRDLAGMTTTTAGQYAVGEREGQ